MEIITATYQMQFIKWVENEYRYRCLEEQGMKASGLLEFIISLL